MSLSDFSSVLSPELLAALTQRGFTELTQVQRAVLEASSADRDLRISSQTGSGKTVAIGLALRALAGAACPSDKGIARPRALIIVPTRELAHQVQQELTWLYAASRSRIAPVTGGASYRDEHRALSQGPVVVVGTPGRLLDHLKRGAIDASQVEAVVLDEADRMLDLGFREELDAILACLPLERRTHLVSATFRREVRALAERIQTDPVAVEGTRLGAANADIDHVIHLVDADQRFDAIVNLLLADPSAQTLIFVRMRADAAQLAHKLQALGFAVSALSGEMAQLARNRALDAFKRAELKVLVATDVAARGIDVQDIARVIHADPPGQGDAYTHRSGRTGRAGRKGISSLLVAPRAVAHATRLLRGLGVEHRFEPIPNAQQLRDAADARIVAELHADAPDAATESPHHIALARRLISAGDVERTLARLLARARYAGVTEPRELRQHDAPRHTAGRGAGRTVGPAAREWVPFRVSWGEEHGADARRLLAIACRRGEIAGSDIGAIRVERRFAIVDVAREVADEFAVRAAERDARDPRIIIQRDRSAPARPAVARAHAAGRPTGPWQGGPRGKRHRPSPRKAAAGAPAARRHKKKSRG